MGRYNADLEESGYKATEIANNQNADAFSQTRMMDDAIPGEELSPSSWRILPVVCRSQDSDCLMICNATVNATATIVSCPKPHKAQRQPQLLH